MEEVFKFILLEKLTFCFPAQRHQYFGADCNVFLEWLLCKFWRKISSAQYIDFSFDLTAQKTALCIFNFYVSSFLYSCLKSREWTNNYNRTSCTTLLKKNLALKRTATTNFLSSCTCHFTSADIVVCNSGSHMNVFNRFSSFLCKAFS